MPTTIPFNVPKKSPQLEFRIYETGITSWFSIPYVFSFPYFSSSIPKIKLEVLNNSDEKQRGMEIIMSQYSDQQFQFSDKAIEKTTVIKVEIENMTGKQSV